MSPHASDSRRHLPRSDPSPGDDVLRGRSRCGLSTGALAPRSVRRRRAAPNGGARRTRRWRPRRPRSGSPWRSHGRARGEYARTRVMGAVRLGQDPGTGPGGEHVDDDLTPTPGDRVGERELTGRGVVGLTTPTTTHGPRADDRALTDALARTSFAVTAVPTRIGAGPHHGWHRRPGRAASGHPPDGRPRPRWVPGGRSTRPIGAGP